MRIVSFLLAALMLFGCNHLTKVAYHQPPGQEQKFGVNKVVCYEANGVLKCGNNCYYAGGILQCGNTQTVNATATPSAVVANIYHVNNMTYGCVDSTVPCGGSTPVPFSWFAANATLMQSNTTDMNAFRGAGGKHTMLYTDPNKVVPYHKEALWDVSESGWCHSSLPAQTITVTSAVTTLGSQTVNYTGSYTPVVNNTALADTTGNPDDILFTAVTGTTFTANFGRTHTANFTVALNRLYNMQNNGGVNAATNHSLYGNDNLLIPSASSNFASKFNAQLSPYYAQTNGYDYVEIDDVAADYPVGILYNFYKPDGTAATTCAEVADATAYKSVLQYEFGIVSATAGAGPIANGSNNIDTTYNNSPPGPADNQVVVQYLVGQDSAEGCIMNNQGSGVLPYKLERDWLGNETTALTDISQHKIDICFTQTGLGAGSSMNAARMFYHASVMLYYDGVYAYEFENLATGGTDIFVFPEQQIVPLSPVQTATSNDVRTLKYGWPGSTTGVYYREFTSCYQNGVSINHCAVFVNPSTSTLNMPPTNLLTYTYSEKAFPTNIYNLYDGGAITWSAIGTFPTTLASHSALIVRQ